MLLLVIVSVGATRVHKAGLYVVHIPETGICLCGWILYKNSNGHMNCHTSEYSNVYMTWHTFMLYIGAAMTPRPSTSSSCFCSRPAFCVSVRPSARVVIMVPIIMFTTSFMLAPLPTCTHAFSALQASNSGSVRLAEDRYPARKEGGSSRHVNRH